MKPKPDPDGCRLSDPISCRQEPYGNPGVYPCSKGYGWWHGHRVLGSGATYEEREVNTIHLSALKV